MGSISARHRISRIAIVGAGPAGISAAKYLLAENTFDQIDIFEQRRQVGGVWNLTSNLLSSKIPIPQLDPNYDATTIGDPNQAGDGTDDRFETALYETLETNIPKQLMHYGSLPFASHLPVFPSHKSVLDYCNEYAKSAKGLIHFNTRISSVHPADRDNVDGNDKGDSAAATGWILTVTDEATSPSRSDHRRYDAVVVANGHYSVPHIPSISGIEAWSSAYPGVIMHSKAYRNPTMFASKKVVVVGNFASGIDIGAQIGQVCQRPLLQASRTESIFLSPGPTDGVPWKEDVPQIVEFLDPQQHHRAVQFANGRIESGVDAVLFATGYYYSFPFLKLDPPVVSDGTRTRDVYEQIFHIRHPTLAFALLPQKVIPFPTAENQAAVIARVWSGRLSLPSSTKMREREKAMLAERGEGKAMHVLNFPQDADYLNKLYDWAASAPPRYGLENNGVGKLGTRWGNRQQWMRAQLGALKKAYAERGEARFLVRTIEELGFHYEEAEDDNREKYDDSKMSTQPVTNASEG